MISLDWNGSISSIDSNPQPFDTKFHKGNFRNCFSNSCCNSDATLFFLYIKNINHSSLYTTRDQKEIKAINVVLTILIFLFTQMLNRRANIVIHLKLFRHVTMKSVKSIFPYEHNFSSAVQDDFITVFKWLKCLHKSKISGHSDLPRDLFIEVSHVLIIK